MYGIWSFYFIIIVFLELCFICVFDVEPYVHEKRETTLPGINVNS
jgi:hypothetical protein